MMAKKNKILFIEPSDSWVTNNKALINFEQVMIPIGLMYLSAYMKKYFNRQVETKILSTMTDFNGNEEFSKLLESFMPDIVCIRSVIFYTEKVFQLVDVIREKSPESLIILGGPNVSSDNAVLLNNRKIDIFVEGEGEESLKEIVKTYIEHGKTMLLDSLESLGGILFWKNGKVVGTPKRACLRNLDELPFPDYHGIDLEKYTSFLNYGYSRRKMGVLFTSRGCPYRCTYCHNVFGKSFRARSAENIYEEVSYLNSEFGICDFCIVDDNFTFDRKRVEKFTDMMITKGPKVNFYFPNGIRADSLTKDLMDRLIASGAIWMTFSLETASKRLQKLIKKNMDIEKLEEMVHYACEKNVITNLCLMVGFPTETVEEAEESLKYFAGFKKVVLPYYFALKYYPGTEIFKDAGNYGIMINKETYEEAYHHASFQETPLIKRRDFERLNHWYLRNIFLNRERLNNSVEILAKHFSVDEIKDMFTLFFRRRVKDIDKDVLNYIMS
ncbi:MAG: B12-binding domain-containing radical SAM protein [Clostridia bacterium]|nr:B12-binding domain-containing radical SAM protein [Clostridia bacterium]